MSDSNSVHNQNLSKTYEPHEIEKKWYQSWLEDEDFSSQKRIDDPNQDKSKVFTLLMPPPNVTGKLHIGHALNHTLHDVLTRFKRMDGYITTWIPGQDHAGIATQAKVEKKLYEEEGLTKHDLGREKFLEKVWQWKNEYGDHIMNQFHKLGDSCDWSRFTFTMDDIPAKAVRTFFVNLYNEGLIYQADYIINWDTTLQSAISDAEVEHQEVKGAFYHLKYKVKDSDDFLEIATTRPETLFGDTAVAVHPDDPRFQHLIGKTAIVPLVNREVPIIADEHVELEVGTGALKVTPGHDFNDFEIGLRHKLEIINIINDDGKLNHVAQDFEGLDILKSRSKVVDALKEKDLYLSEKPHTHPVGHGQRSGTIVQPRVSKQWFLNTEALAKDSVLKVEKEEMSFFPKGWENTYFSYQKNPRPWCLSRQLWWGHQIPVYTCDSCGHVHASVDEPNTCPKCGHNSLTQDPDVLDTWFSSGLFPLSTLGWPDEEKMKENAFDLLYPSHTLITAHDIIFFWVARMMMMCSKAHQNMAPFKHTYIHALVRDKNGKKMSKSLGNVIDPIDLIEEYGCDALRFTLSANSGYNRDINLDPKVIEGYRNFMNKVWNAFRFLNSYLDQAPKNKSIKDFDLDTEENWILAELEEVIQIVRTSLELYRFDDASKALYQFVYEKFCSSFIELSKNNLNSKRSEIREQRAFVLWFVFRELVKLLHPFSPFITEEIWSHLKTDQESKLIHAPYPVSLGINDDQAKRKMRGFLEVVSTVRSLKNEVAIPPKNPTQIEIRTNNDEVASFLHQQRHKLKDLCSVIRGNIKNKNQVYKDKSVMMALSFGDLYMPFDGDQYMQPYLEKIKRELKKQEEEKNKLEKKLGNPKFLDNAPDEVVKEVKMKHQEAANKYSSLNETLGRLS